MRARGAAFLFTSGGIGEAAAGGVRGMRRAALYGRDAEKCESGGGRNDRHRVSWPIQGMREQDVGCQGAERVAQSDAHGCLYR